jgi:hypothetical protein
MKQLALSIVLFFGIASAFAQFLDKKKDLQEYNGFFNFHYSEADGEIYLEVNRLNEEFLYVHSLSTGLGSNDIGLDRGQLGDGVIVKFIRSGNKLLLVQQNMKYRADTDNQFERKSIEQAFARSVLFGFDIKETKGDSHVIDLTPFLLLDAHGVAENLKKNKEGTYKLDKSRLALWLENTKAFPKNVEFEALLTYVGEPTGKNLQTVAPDPRSISVIQHHSFVELPKHNYKPRTFDPRSGSYPIHYMDYSTPIWEPIKKRFITRHHLEKKNPEATVSEAKEPIIYYLDPGTPEPIRSALLEGASWWNEAFEAIGYKDAFQVKLLPADADPMDLRYNVIQWVHRSTRGWSYGSTINDPRTGEIIKGHVSLGSLRIRQDFLIAQALMNQPFKENDNNYQPMLDMALARIRQLSAHEVGHTLGFSHNFAASTNNRASVMDYPHPMLSLRKESTNWEIDFSNAYATGIGEWDKVAVAYSYIDIKNGVSENSALGAILDNAFSNGMRYISDSDARAQSGAHSKAHLWDNGENAKSELLNVLAVRKLAIERFSKDNIRNGEPYSKLEDVFVPLYFYHRYQMEAVVKMIGGMDYEYGVKGNEQIETKVLSVDEQMEALVAVLETLSVQNLAIPKKQLALFPPRAQGYDRTRESFKSNNGVAFDALGAAATAADMTLGLLLHPERANRLVAQNAIDPSKLKFETVLDELNMYIFGAKASNKYESEVGHAIQYVTLQHLLNLLVNEKSIPQVKGLVNTKLDALIRELPSRGEKVFSKQLVREIKEFREHPERFKMIKTPKIPDGSPIGSFECYYN